MRVLIVDNTLDPDSWGSSDLVRLAHLASGVTVHVRRAPHGDLPPDPAAYDRIIVSGSRTSALETAQWIDQLHAFIRKALDQRKPYLGVCYGHQSLVRALGGLQSVRKAAQPEFGWSKIELLGQSALTQGLPGEFHSFSSHYEEVAQLPKGMRNLARSEACAVQACWLEGAPAYGIQFHPERDLAGAKKSLAEKKKKKEPSPLLRPDESDTLYDPKIGETIFRNFLSL